MAAHDLVAVDGLGERGRQIDHHVALAESEIHGGEPVERSRKLAQPLAHRHVERGERLRPDAAGLREAVTRLEAAHRGGDRVVVDLAAGLIGREVVGDGEPLAQQRHVRTARAGSELAAARRQRRPAALHLEHRVAQHGGGDALDGALVEGRLRRLRHPEHGRLCRHTRRRGLGSALRQRGSSESGRKQKRDRSGPCCRDQAVTPSSDMPLRRLHPGPGETRDHVHDSNELMISDELIAARAPRVPVLARRDVAWKVWPADGERDAIIQCYATRCARMSPSRMPSRPVVR